VLFMTCEESRDRLIELARSGVSGPPLCSDLAAHLDGCAGCAGFLDDQIALHGALAALAAESDSLAAPRGVEAGVLAEFDAARRGAVRRWIPAAIALAAGIAVAVLLVRWPEPTTHIGRERPFVQIPYVAPLAPYERVAVRRMEVPVTALIAAGFEMRARDLGAAIPADVLVGQDGRALALRLVEERRD
jgi:hypothetical protein